MTFLPGVVIPVGRGREANLHRVLDDLDAQILQPQAVVIVWDGFDPVDVGKHPYPLGHQHIPKHEPGQEQPRNVGVRLLRRLHPQCTHVWFLDGDIAVGPDCLDQFAAAHALNAEPRIMLGPYEWLPQGARGLSPGTRNDYRWISFDEHPPQEVCYHPIGAGLACLSGNLVWPLDEFEQVGGFWSELHHGRCEDGELGIRAVSAGIGVSFVKNARGYHQWHERDTQEIARRNSIDVPKINRRHPFMPDAEGIGGNRGAHLLMTAKDGIRFDFRCPGCDRRMNSLLFWEHCGGTDWECPDT